MEHTRKWVGVSLTTRHTTYKISYGIESQKPEAHVLHVIEKVADNTWSLDTRGLKGGLCSILRKEILKMMIFQKLSALWERKQCRFVYIIFHA